MKRITHYLMKRGQGKSSEIAKQVLKDASRTIIIFPNEQHRNAFRKNFQVFLKDWQMVLAHDLTAAGLPEFLRGRNVKRIFFDNYLDCTEANKAATLKFVYSVMPHDIDLVLYSSVHRRVLEESLTVLRFVSQDRHSAAYLYAKFVTLLFWKTKQNVIDILEEGKHEIERDFLTPVYVDVVSKYDVCYTKPLNDYLDGLDSIDRILESTKRNPLSSGSFFL